MRETFRLPDDSRMQRILTADGRTADRALKNFRYVVDSVNNDALRVWAELWNELREGVTPGGIVPPTTSEGFTPSCGWAEFLEKFCLMKHYLDYVHRFCKASTST